MRKRMQLFLVLVALLATALAACAAATPEPVREEAVVEEQRVDTANLSDQIRQALIDRYGFAIEPELLAERILRANDPAALEYVYLISPYTGDIILRATAVGKAVSTTKRLDTKQSYDLTGNYDCGEYGCQTWLAFERIGTDGSYGSSTPRIFWFDTSGQKFEVAVGGATLVTTERPYVFANNQIDLSVDIRLQGQIDPEREAQRIAVAEYIRSHPDWRPGDEIPLEILTEAWELYGDQIDVEAAEESVEDLIVEPTPEPTETQEESEDE